MGKARLYGWARRGVVGAVLSGAILVSGDNVSVHGSGVPMLIASPIEGHSGDTVYLSGTGLAPHQHLYVMMACPNWYDPTVSVYHNASVLYDGPTTDQYGQFKAFPFQVLTLHYWKSLGCQFYVPEGANPYGPRFPATYTILPRGVSAHSPCSRRICLQVKTSPGRVQSGMTEKITVRPTQNRPWPGTKVQVNVSYPGGSVKRQLTLNVNGTATTNFRVAAGGSQSVLAKVRVAGRLGVWAGAATSHFTIVHPSRDSRQREGL